jgi:radical SAM protein with 4Fe4S-binding SPASM domain
VDFALPIRIRWDIDSQGRAGPVRGIAARIREVEPLFVELAAAGPEGLSRVPEIVEALAGSSPRVTLTLGPFPGAAGAGLPPGVGRILRVEGPEGLGDVPDGGEASFAPDGASFGRLPALLGAFSRSGASVLHLPNVNAVRALAEGGRVPVPSPGQYEAFDRSPELESLDLGARGLAVHDYFLWRILARRFPASAGERLEFGGCQAGGALAYVAPDGGLYPCDALPVRIGSLAGERSFRELWDGPARTAALAAVRATPAGCEGCGALPSCRAGCRGLAHAGGGGIESPDPACPGPVKA